MAEAKIDTLVVDIDYSAGQANTGLTSLTNTLQTLQSTVTPAISKLNSMSNSINKFVQSANGLNTTTLTQFSQSINSLSSAVKPLSELGKSNLGSFVNQLKKIPELNKSLDPNMISEFTKKIKDLSNAMTPLANNMAKVTAGFSSLPSKLNKVNSYTSKTTKSMGLLSNISNLLNFGTVVAFATRAGRALGGFVTQSNQYVENLNLFNVAMGESADRAKEWIDNVSEVLGLDPAPMMRYMGVFNMMATGFGLSSDNAEKMSKNLTQLTYDIASFYNLNIDEAAQKVQSAFAGELEPVDVEPTIIYIIGIQQIAA